MSTILLANLREHFWQLRSGEQLHSQHPDRFQIPPVSARQSLRRGQGAKLIFETEGKHEDGSTQTARERMWVIVLERIGDVYIGLLDNEPAAVEGGYLRRGVEVPFAAEHVIDIDDPPENYVAARLAEPVLTTWPRR